LIAGLLKEPERFAYFQALRLLTLAHGEDYPIASDFLEKGLLTRGSPSMAFPASDLVEAEALYGQNDPQALGQTSPLYALTVTFMGLYGGASPLPALYGQAVIDESLDDERSVRDFLDILAAPFHRLHALAHFRNQLAIRLIELEDPEGLQILHGLLGLASRLAPAGSLGERLAQMALWARHSRPAKGLKILLSESLGWPVELETFVPRVVPIPEEARARLGIPASPRLGEGALTGETASDVRSKFNVHLTPPDEATFLSLLPGGEARARADEIIRSYAQEPLESELILHFRPGAIGGTTLGDGMGLGQNAFLTPPEDLVFDVRSPASPYGYAAPAHPLGPSPLAAAPPAPATAGPGLDAPLGPSSIGALKAEDESQAKAKAGAESQAEAKAEAESQAEAKAEAENDAPKEQRKATPEPLGSENAADRTDRDHYDHYERGAIESGLQIEGPYSIEPPLNPKAKLPTALGPYSVEPLAAEAIAEIGPEAKAPSTPKSELLNGSERYSVDALGAEADSPKDQEKTAFPEPLGSENAADLTDRDHYDHCERETLESGPQGEGPYSIEPPLNPKAQPPAALGPYSVDVLGSEAIAEIGPEAKAPSTPKHGLLNRSESHSMDALGSEAEPAPLAEGPSAPPLNPGPRGSAPAAAASTPEPQPTKDPKTKKAPPKAGSPQGQGGSQ
jgi:type VI secretion system protein ImpH